MLWQNIVTSEKKVMVSSILVTGFKGIPLAPMNLPFSSKAITFWIKGWGHKDPQSSIGYSVSIKELEGALVDFKPILQHLLWSAPFRNFCEKYSSSWGPLRANSNGSGNLDLDEATEYGTLVLAAVELAGDIQKKTPIIAKM